MLRVRWPWCLALLLLLAACAGGNPDDVPAGTAPADEQEEEEEDYEVLLGNALTDTLRGDARFGYVVDPDANQPTFIVELKTGYDFAGGFFVARGGEALPTPGEHPLLAVSDSLKSVPPGRYAIIYRQGMVKDLASQAGTVTFTTVTDTLIEGTFDALLYGFVAKGRQRLPNAEIRARGHFSARPGSPGFIIGL